MGHLGATIILARQEGVMQHTCCLSLMCHHGQCVTYESDVKKGRRRCNMDVHMRLLFFHSAY